MTKKRIILALGFIMALAIFLRFWHITTIPLGLYPDEATNGNNALEAIANTNFSAEGGPALGWKVFYPENNGREGFFINVQALSLWLFGNHPWALRIVSAFFGSLTVLGMYFITKELFVTLAPYDSLVGLLASFFTATSYWHINFSRIGFRAIMVPFVTAFGTYFLLKALRRGKIWDAVFAGIFLGLGFHTYIAYRFVPFYIAAIVGWYLWQWWKKRDSSGAVCSPCIISLFIFVAFVVALPIGLYFLHHPEDLVGRGSQVSIFAAPSPALEFLKSNALEIGMFFVHGDCNWRHNYKCYPELSWPVMIFFAVGILALIKNLARHDKKLFEPFLFLAAWLVFMSLPATLTREGMPHALRSIGLIPPVMIVSGIGAWFSLQAVRMWFEKQSIKWPQFSRQILRIRKEVGLLFVFFLLLVPMLTYIQYFGRWAYHPYTYFAFASDLAHMGTYLNELPVDMAKLVVVNTSGVEVRGIPMPAQTIMFITDTFREEKRAEKNIVYLLPAQAEQAIRSQKGPFVVMFLNGLDRDLVGSLRRKFPELKAAAPEDFTILRSR